MGLLKTRYFYRRPVGPGFALAGDAGHFKDFVTGQGMADAFLDADRLARAVLDGRPEAFEHYWRARDVATLPLHFDAIRQGRVGQNDPFMRWVIRCVAARPDLTSRLPLVTDRKLSPADFIPMRTMLGFMGRALLRGQLEVISGFFRAGKEMGKEGKELSERRAMLDEASKRLESAPPRQASPEDLARRAA